MAEVILRVGEGIAQVPPLPVGHEPIEHLAEEDGDPQRRLAQLLEMPSDPHGVLALPMPYSERKTGFWPVPSVRSVWMTRALCGNGLVGMLIGECVLPLLIARIGKGLARAVEPAAVEHHHPRVVHRADQGQHRNGVVENGVLERSR